MTAEYRVGSAVASRRVLYRQEREGCRKEGFGEALFRNKQFLSHDFL
jgi:hypothetical protein